MFISIGSGIHINIKDIICIIDTENTDKNALNRLVKKILDNGTVFELCKADEVRSAVLTNINNKFSLYLVPSPVSAIGRRRAKDNIKGTSKNFV